MNGGGRADGRKGELTGQREVVSSGGGYGAGWDWVGVGCGVGGGKTEEKFSLLWRTNYSMGL